MSTVKLFGGFRRTAGISKMTATGETVRSVLDMLCADNAKLRAEIMDGNKLRDHVRVMIDGHDIELGQGLETPVDSNSEIAVFPPVAGGIDS